MKIIQLYADLMALGAITAQPVLQSPVERRESASYRLAVASVVQPSDSPHGVAVVVRQGFCAVDEMPQVVVPVAQVVDDPVALLCAETALDAAPFPCCSFGRLVCPEGLGVEVSIRYLYGYIYTGIYIYICLRLDEIKRQKLRRWVEKEHRWGK